MNNLIQVIPVLTPEEVEFVNTELDKKEFSVSLIGFADDESGLLSGRVDSNIRSSSGCCLNDDEEAADDQRGGNRRLLDSVLVFRHPHQEEHVGDELVDAIHRFIRDVLLEDDLEA